MERVLERRKICVLLMIFAIVVLFLYFAKLDWTLTHTKRAKATYDIKVVRVGAKFFWLWCVGYPLLATVLAFMYYAGSSDFWGAVGVFLTVMLLAFGQLEDFFYHLVNPGGFPTVEWGEVYTWNKETSIYYRLFGTWTTEMHFVWLACFVFLVIGMWALIFHFTD